VESERDPRCQVDASDRLRRFDGKVLTQPIAAALASGRVSRVPVINGTNHDEWRAFWAQAG
jgi:hypothetical protein